jgi:molecular chaperone GrpE (heat shock protein)
MTDLGNGFDRAAILRRFEDLVDSALAAEAPPSGIDAEILDAVMSGGASEEESAHGDSYAVWSAITALTQEVRLEGRAFQELTRTLAGQTERVAEELRAVYAERERSVQRETERRCRKEALSALIDLRDRLGRGLASMQASRRAAPEKTGWWQRLFAKPATESTSGPLSALVRGYELGLERLDQTLAEYNAREIRCEGEIFDPRRMNAIESEISDSVPAGTVLEVYLSGWEWNGEIFRPAQVKVSRGPDRGQ